MGSTAKEVAQSAEAPDITSDGFVSVAGAAQFLGISRAMAYKLMDAGELAFGKIGKCRRVPKRSLAEFARKSLVRE